MLDGPDFFRSWDLFDADDIEERPSRIMDGGGIMIWGCMHQDGFFTIRPIDGTLNGEKYKYILEKDIIPLLNKRYNRSYIFQQDNGRPHTCNLVKKKIKTFSWPSKSSICK